ncbi:restriction endonuclease, SacI family [Elusimicrobiota bacterium]
MRISQARATEILKEECRKASHGVAGDAWWDRLVKDLAIKCEEGSKTCIAALGTAIVAKAVDLNVDAFSLQASDGKRGYSARAIAQHVLAANAIELNLNIGVEGREPLNNQPFFAKARITSKLPVKKNGLPAFGVLLKGLERLEKCRSKSAVRAVLRSFIKARTVHRRRVAIPRNAGDTLTTITLCKLISRFVRLDAENGKRAQAVTAGVLDAVCGEERVLVAKIHDPDRRFPCDVGILADKDDKTASVVLEVRDKIVVDSDIFHAVMKALRADVMRVGILAVAKGQTRLDADRLGAWAEEQGAILRIWTSWEEMIRESLFWGTSTHEMLPGLAFRRILRRAENLEVSPAGLQWWKSQSKHPE